MLQTVIKKVFGTASGREVKRLGAQIERINAIEQELQSLSITQLQAKTAEFKQRLEQGQTLEDLKFEAFAVVKNCCRRFAESKRNIEVRGQMMTWDMIPYDVQLIGGLVLHEGKIAEMATGEGKTLVATLPCYLNALTGKGVHVVTVNDYLAARDAEWMGEIHKFLGLTVGCIQEGQSPEERRQIYACDVVYGTNAQYGFDYLRDNGMARNTEEQVQREHFYCIIDEVDSILIDEARTPLIISGPASVSTHQYDTYKDLVSRLVRKQNALCNELAAEAKKLLDDEDIPAAGTILQKVKMGAPRNKQFLKMIENPEVRRAVDDAELALYQDPKHSELYRVKEELFYSIDERRSDSDISEKGRRFLDPDNPEAFVLPDLITTNHDIDADMAKNQEEKEEAKRQAQESYDRSSERIHNILQLLRAYAVYEKDVHYIIQENKVIIVDEHTGRPMPGRRWSDGLHQAVEAKEGVQIERETQTWATITIQNYFRLYEKLSGMTGTAETEANEFRDIYKLAVISIPTNRPCVREDFDDLIYNTKREKLKAVIEDIRERHAKGQPMLVGTASVESSEVIDRLLSREKIPHSVLNAKYHQQEAEIVARAGQRGAVTIATNMAGRGTDIKLGPGVKELGGLHVIGTERHEARRIDRQLRGRCARQGDPGSSQFFISFEDDLMRNFGDSRRISGLMTKLGMEENEGLQHPWLNRTVEGAQKRVEERNYMIRKHTLEYDDVMNQQRTVIYEHRNDVLTSENLKEDIFGYVNEVIEEETEARLQGADPDIEGYVKWLNTSVPLLGLKQEDLDWNHPPDQVAEKIKQRILEIYERKAKYEDPEATQHLERHIVLNAIDRLWQEHLYTMDGLRTSIGLRAIAQKNPLMEYKQEAYTMFSQLMNNIKTEVLNNLFRSTTNLAAFEQFLQGMSQRLVHEMLPGFAGMTPQGGPGSETQSGTAGGQTEPEPELHLPIRRDIEKIGRNEVVKIQKNGEIKTLKFKKAQELIDREGWRLIGKD